MDKQRVLEIVESSDVLCNRCQDTNEIQYVVFTPGQLQQFFAQILLEAARVCSAKVADLNAEVDSDGNDCTEQALGAEVCSAALEQLAKGLTQ